MPRKINLTSNLQVDLKQLNQKHNISPTTRKYRSQDIHNPQQSSHNFPSYASTKEQNIIPLDKLMKELNKYRGLKQLSLNSISQQKESLWRDSPCTVRCISRHVSVDRTQKFTIGSIYHKDNIHEQKKVFTQSQKPELMLKNFRRQIEQSGPSKYKYNQNSSEIKMQKAKINLKFRKTMNDFQNKFYQVPPKTQLKFDRNGYRSAFTGEYNVKQIINKIRSTSSNFTSSRRMDLALPSNFNPGPGKYFPQVADQNFCESYRSRINRTLTASHQMSQRQHGMDHLKQKV